MADNGAYGIGGNVEMRWGKKIYAQPFSTSPPARPRSGRTRRPSSSGDPSLTVAPALGQDGLGRVVAGVDVQVGDLPHQAEGGRT